MTNFYSTMNKIEELEKDLVSTKEALRKELVEAIRTLGRDTTSYQLAEELLGSPTESNRRKISGILNGMMIRQANEVADYSLRAHSVDESRYFQELDSHGNPVGEVKVVRQSRMGYTVR